jgi:hypothetical protein
MKKKEIVPHIRFHITDGKKENIRNITYSIYKRLKSGKKVKIGNGTGYILDNKLKGKALVELAKECDWETLEMVEEVYKCYDDPIFYTNTFKKLIILSTMVINPSYRGYKIGHKVIHNFFNLFEGELFLIYPAPLTNIKHKYGRKAGQKKLQKYWSDMGFIEVGNTGYYYYI